MQPASASNPYNPTNIVLSASDLQKLLLPWGHDGVVRDINIFRKAFVHRSYCVRKNENCITGNVNCPDDCLPLQEESNERLEFLGDSVLGIIIARYLFERFPDENEGFLTKMRTKLVNGQMLGHLASIIDLGKYVILSSQIEECEGRASVRILEDCLEAFIGAMFLDNESNLDKVSNWIIGLIEQNLDFSELIVLETNHKDMMLKHYQQSFGYIPKFFDVSADACGKQKMYIVCAKDNKGVVIGKGQGRTKKQAENDCSLNIIAQHKIGV